MILWNSHYAVHSLSLLHLMIELLIERFMLSIEAKESHWWKLSADRWSDVESEYLWDSFSPDAFWLLTEECYKCDKKKILEKKLLKKDTLSQ